MKCIICEKEFSAVRKGHVTCSKECNSKKWRLQNKDYIKIYNKSYKKENKEKCATYTMEWKKENKEINARHAGERRARQKQAVYKGHDEELYEFFMQEIYSLSRERSEKTGVEHNVDHIIPLNNEKVCGLHTPCNLRIITALENQRKNNTLDISTICIN